MKFYKKMIKKEEKKKKGEDKEKNAGVKLKIRKTKKLKKKTGCYALFLI